MPVASRGRSKRTNRSPHFWRGSPVAHRIANLAAAPDAEVSLNIGYFINEPQWQERDDATVARGLGVSLNAAQIELLHQMRADFDVDIYVNSEIE